MKSRLFGFIFIVFIFSSMFASGQLIITNESECLSTGECHYNYTLPSWFSIDTGYSDDYDIIINVKDPAGDWHGYWETLTQCISDGKCTNVSSGNIDFSYTHPEDGNVYVNIQVDDTWYNDWTAAYMYHDVTTGVSFEDSQFEACLRENLNKPTGSITEEEILTLSVFSCDNNVGVKDIKLLPNGIDATIQGVYGKILYHKFVSGKISEINGKFIAGREINGRFAYGISGPRGFVPGVIDDDGVFTHGVFDNIGYFIHGVVRDGNFIPGVMIRNRFIPAISIRGYLIPGTFVSANEFQPGIFKDGGFIPGRVENNQFIPGTFRVEDSNGTTIFQEGMAMDIGDALLLDQLSILGGGATDLGAFYNTGGFSSGNMHYEDGVGWMPSNGQGGGDFGYGGSGDGVTTGGHYDASTGWMTGGAGNPAYGMSPGMAGTYEDGVGFMPAYSDDYAGYVGATTSSSTKTKHGTDANGNQYTQTTTTATTQNDDGSSSVTVTTVKTTDYGDGHSTTESTSVTDTYSATGGHSGKSVSHSKTETFSDGTTIDVPGQQWEHHADFGDSWDDAVNASKVVGGAVMGGLATVAGAGILLSATIGIGTTAILDWLSKMPADPWEDGNPYILSDTLMPADPWDDGGNPYALANNLLPADPWDDGGTVFFGLFGYPADVDGRDGPIFYNSALAQQ